MKTVEELAAKARSFTKPEERSQRLVFAMTAAEAAIAAGTWALCPFDAATEQELVERWEWYVGMRKRGGRPIGDPTLAIESDAYRELMGGGA